MMKRAETEGLNRAGLPGLEVVDRRAMPGVAEVFTLRTRPGDDRSLIELVSGLAPPLPREEKWIANLSTQFGCPLGCLFCDAGSAWHGNLSAEEMLAETAFVLALYPETAAVCRKLKVHFARMGEPALNDAVVDAVRLLPGLGRLPGLWACVATVAPAGREGWFDRLFDEKERAYRGRFQLQFSLNSTDPSVRTRLTPARLLDLDRVAILADDFFRPGDRRVVLNFALARGVPFEAAAIIDRFDPGTVCVKLTPLNPTAAGAASGLATVLRAGHDEGLEREMDRLHAAGFELVVSIGDGREDEIGSNCGQSVRRLRPIGDIGHPPSEQPLDGSRPAP